MGEKKMRQEVQKTHPLQERFCCELLSVAEPPPPGESRIGLPRRSSTTPTGFLRRSLRRTRGIVLRRFCGVILRKGSGLGSSEPPRVGFEPVPTPESFGKGV